MTGNQPQRVKSDLRLLDNESESASGHVETKETASLGFDEKGRLLLTHFYETKNFIDPSRGDSRTETFTIDARELCRLIERHGTRV